MLTEDFHSNVTALLGARLVRGVFARSRDLSAEASRSVVLGNCGPHDPIDRILVNGFSALLSGPPRLAEGFGSRSELCWVR